MKVAVLGYGTVGRGVYEMICSSDFLEAGPVLVLPFEKTEDFMVTSIDEITGDDSVEAVCECMGGVSAAFDFAVKVMNAGKHFVTSNKALVAAKGIELSELSREKNVGFLFSAACGGAIPVLHNISVAKKTDEILSAGGIINGTTNFILSGIEEGKFTDYQDALRVAQKLGYAEADPTADVSGLDTLRKVILLSAVSFGLLPVDGMLLEGIENIDLFRETDSKVRLIGCCGKNENGTVYSYVEPVLLKPYSTFAGVTSNFNQVMYKGKNSGTISLYGQGAGRYPTASAVLRDLTAIAAGERAMLPESCVGCTADNRFIKHKYYISEGNKSHITDFVSVADMHREAKEMRESGRKVFFAEIEE